MFWGGGNFSCTHPKLYKWLISNLKAFFIGGAISFVVTASATVILHSRQVRYKSDKSVEQAINELYEKAEQLGLKDKYELKKLGCKGCTKLEYLESTGTQYIDTGLKSSVNTQILTKLNWLDVTTRQLFGANTGMYFGVVNGYWQLGQLGNSTSSLSVKTNTWYDVDYKLSPNSSNYRNTLVIDNDTVTYDRNFMSNMKIYLFTIGDVDDVNTSYISNCKLGPTKIKQNDNLVRDYIPVLDKNKRPCLFDKVEKKCYYNQGTGEFLYG